MIRSRAQSLADANPATVREHGYGQSGMRNVTDPGVYEGRKKKGKRRRGMMRRVRWAGRGSRRREVGVLSCE